MARARFALGGAIVIVLVVGQALAGGALPTVSVQTRNDQGVKQQESRAFDPAKCAIVVIDMWDRHWCTTFTARCESLIPRMNKTLAAARKLGIQVVFAPSDTMDAYRDDPHRQAMLAIPQHPAPPLVEYNPPPCPGPTDCCECSIDRPCHSGGVWTRQNAAIEVKDGDLFADCEKASELLNLCAERKIDTLVYMGVASNMCVLHRPSGMINMKRHGLKTLLVSDLALAFTSNGLDDQKKPNRDFTPAAGTARAQRFIEQHAAGTFESDALIRLAGFDADRDDHRPRVVLIAAEDEYRSSETLPEFAKNMLAKDYRTTVLAGVAENDRYHVPGLEALDDADALVLSMRRRSLSAPETDRLERFIRAGKPLVVVRAGVVPFRFEGTPARGYVVWDHFDEQILGCRYRAYNPQSREKGTDVTIAPNAKDHVIVKGLAFPLHSTSWLYRQNPLAESASVLLMGKSTDDPAEPVAWTNRVDGGRVFYTSLGHLDDFQSPAFRQLLARGLKWTLETDATAAPRAAADK